MGRGWIEISSRILRYYNREVIITSSIDSLMQLEKQFLGQRLYLKHLNVQYLSKSTILHSFHNDEVYDVYRYAWVINLIDHIAAWRISTGELSDLVGLFYRHPLFLERNK